MCGWRLPCVTEALQFSCSLVVVAGGYQQAFFDGTCGDEATSYSTRGQPRSSTITSG